MKSWLMALALLFLFILAVWAICSDGAPAAEDSTRIIRDVYYADYSGADRSLTSLDLYVPARGTDFPVLIFVHGGAWTMGDKGNQTGKFSRFTGEGFLCASVNYRLAPSVTYKEQEYDLAKAFAWVYRNISGYGGDPGHIFIMGHSAGAHLCALLAIDERYLGRESLSLKDMKGVILLDGAGYDILKLRENDTKSYRRLYVPVFGDNPGTLRDASPIYHIAPGKGIAPFLIIHAGAREASKEQASLLADGLKKAGVQVEVYHAKDRDHESLNRKLGNEGDGATEALLSFMSRHK